MILLVTLARLGYRMQNPPPPFPPELPAWERVVAVWNHRLFYLLLIAMPIVGLGGRLRLCEWLTTPLIGGLAIPVIPGISKETGDMAGEVHEFAAYLLVLLIVIQPWRRAEASVHRSLARIGADAAVQCPAWRACDYWAGSRRGCLQKAEHRERDALAGARAHQKRAAKPSRSDIRPAARLASRVAMPVTNQNAPKLVARRWSGALSAIIREKMPCVSAMCAPHNRTPRGETRVARRLGGE